MMGMRLALWLVVMGSGVTVTPFGFTYNGKPFTFGGQPFTYGSGS